MSFYQYWPGALPKDPWIPLRLWQALKLPQCPGSRPDPLWSCPQLQGSKSSLHNADLDQPCQWSVGNWLQSKILGWLQAMLSIPLQGIDWCKQVFLVDWKLDPKVWMRNGCQKNWVPNPESSFSNQESNWNQYLITMGSGYPTILSLKLKNGAFGYKKLKVFKFFKYA